MKNNSFSPSDNMGFFSGTPWGKGVIFFVGATLLMNTAISSVSLSPERREMLQKIVSAQSTLLQFFSFSTLPVLAVDNILKHAGLGTDAPKRPADDPLPANDQCDRCFVRSSVEQGCRIFKDVLYSAVPVADGADIARVIFPPGGVQLDTGFPPAITRLFFFLLPRSSVSEDAAVFFPLNAYTRPDPIRPGIFVPYMSSILGGGL